MNTNSKLSALVWGFALGDALGAPFEFLSPSSKEVFDRFHGLDSIEFTDDTFLVISTLIAFSRSKHLSGQSFWQSMREHTCAWLLDWLDSGDLRGIGDTTYCAVKQMRRHGLSNQNFDHFRVAPERGYVAEMSAGNGILSRAVPLHVLGLAPSEFFRNWLSITHLHEDGHQASDALAAFIQTGKQPGHVLADDALGFYAPETLQIAVNAASSAKTPFEVFTAALVPDGDNDSTAAIALGLWGWKHGLESFDSLRVRMTAPDCQQIEDALGGCH